MPKSSKDTAKRAEGGVAFEARYEELNGFTVAFETYSGDSDPTPLYEGLPDNRCQSPHWGIVLTGHLVYRYADGEETIGAGEAYYVRPGHTALHFAGTEVIEFSPTAEYAKTLEIVMTNGERMGWWG